MPTQLKIFLVSLAIFDDLGAIIIIALFYSSDISTLSLAVAAAMVIILFLMNRFGVNKVAPFILVGVVLWISATDPQFDEGKVKDFLTSTGAHGVRMVDATKEEA